MKVIWKYHIHTLGSWIYPLPKGAKFLSLGKQKNPDTMFKNNIVFWAEVDPKQQEQENWRIHVVPTGSSVPENSTFLGTLIMSEEPPVVFHVYMERK